MKVFITEKGSKIKANNWSEGQEIECHENIGKHFIENGIAVASLEEKPKDKEKPKKK